MTFFQAFVLGVLQGATEFLPVSSSGHLVLVPWLLNWSASSLLFDTVVHLGTLVAVIIYFWADIIELFKGFWSSLRHRSLATPFERLPWLVILGAIPGAVLGYLLDDWFESLFGSPIIVSCLLLVTGVFLFVSDRLGRRERNMRQISVCDAVVMGLGQALAIAPGISRSGSTISAGLLSGLDRPTAARFSFIMGIPLIAGAAVFKISDAFSGAAMGESWGVLAVGFVAAALCGYFAIRWLLNLVQKHSIKGFAYYCWVAGIVGITVWLIR